MSISHARKPMARLALADSVFRARKGKHKAEQSR